MGTDVPTFRGSERFLPSEEEAVMSPAAADLAERANRYSPEQPLYVVAIGAITNVASAILLNPKVVENTVVVWLGGHGYHYSDTAEFNMQGDIAAAKVVMGSGVPFVQLPCMGVVSEFRISEPELRTWLMGKNPLADYLARNTIAAAERYAKGKPWTRVIWDVTAVAWLLNEEDRFMKSRLVPMRRPGNDSLYVQPEGENLVRYVYHIQRDALMEDLIQKLLV